MPADLKLPNEISTDGEEGFFKWDFVWDFFFIKYDALQQKYFSSKKHYKYSWMSARLMNTCSKENRQDKLLSLFPPSTFFPQCKFTLIPRPQSPV